ncbi:hypothetical protein B0H17DRAFT_1139914 [Mycena rosella]|uniref:Uncharacterized protein n=1 Tax=Mycena rosella TaxID=1033263 RepID=A0AAD7D6R4_MYCRO|nr:hypothetical protein B0H17DRAFT_1139914 [Mycena rosella]
MRKNQWDSDSKGLIAVPARRPILTTWTKTTDSEVGRRRPIRRLDGGVSGGLDLSLREDNPERATGILCQHTPAQHMIKYETVKFHRGLHDNIPIYERPSSAEVDQAWEELYAYAASRVPKSEVVKMMNITWPILHEEGNYVIALDVFHQLHCLDLLRQQVHSGHNYTQQSPIHLRHCIGPIRQVLMCYADISPVVWQWSSAHLSRLEQDSNLGEGAQYGRAPGPQCLPRRVICGAYR